MPPYLQAALVAVFVFALFSFAVKWRARFVATVEVFPFQETIEQTMPGALYKQGFRSAHRLPHEGLRLVEWFQVATPASPALAFALPFKGGRPLTNRFMRAGSGSCPLPLQVVLDELAELVQAGEGYVVASNGRIVVRWSAETAMFDTPGARMQAYLSQQRMEAEMPTVLKLAERLQLARQGRN